MPLNPDSITEQRYLLRLLNHLLTVTNQAVPTYGGADSYGAILTALNANTVGTAQATIAHGLSYTPRIYAIVMTSAGTIWQSAVPDATNIYLTADAAARVCNVLVGY